jgi:hypothetical protein
MAVAVATAGAWAVFAGAAPASPSSQASPAADTEDLVSYVTVGKLKPGKRIAYKFVCSTECQVTATSTLVLKGPNLGPAVDTGMFSSGQIAEAFLKPNKAARAAINAHIGASKLRTSIRASNAAGATDTDTRAFRFKA